MPGGHYYGLPAVRQVPPKVENTASLTVMLRVSRSGRRLAAARLSLWCGRGRSASGQTARLSLRGNRAARIRRDGSFSFAAAGSTHTAGRVHLWLSGRFASAQYLRLFYRVRDLPRHRAPDCRTTYRRYIDYSPAVLGFDGQPPFSGCTSQRAATLLRTDTGRVFQQYAPWDESDPWSGGFVTHVYACLFARPKERVDLGRNYDDARVELPRLAGTLLAYEQVGCGPGACASAIRVRDLAGGDVRTVSPTQRSRFEPESFGVSDLVLKENGSLAWTVARYAFGGAFIAFEVWALDSQGARLLDSGPDLNLESLDLDGSTLTWINGSTTRTATVD